MNRVVVFAHFDKHNKIEDYVLFCIKELQKVSSNIIFVSDSELKDAELEKIQNMVTYCVVGRHGEYDFGSYKRGFIKAKENGLLDNCEELVFINDSCYAPLTSFEEIFEKMSSRVVDFWGNTSHIRGIRVDEKRKVIPCDVEHIQSYFLVFKPQVFNSVIFNDFLCSVKQEHNHSDIVAKYEVQLTEKLVENGYKFDVYCDLSRKVLFPHIYLYKDLVRYNHSPFMKRSVVLGNRMNYFVYPFGLKSFIKRFTTYNYDLIKQDILINRVIKNKKTYYLRLFLSIKNEIMNLESKLKKYANS